MKIIYTPNLRWSESPPLFPLEESYISLSGNNFDDYSTGQTTLNTIMVINKIQSPVSAVIKIIIEDCDYTAKKLNELCEEGWDGVFPIPGVNYTSLPTNIDFYKVLLSHFNQKDIYQALDKIKDVGYLKNILGDERVDELIDTPIFTSSLLRDTGSNKAYQDGWRLFQGEESQIRDFQLNILSHKGDKKSIPFKFESNLLPYDINVLIGSNGIGKSFCLKSLVEYWLQTGMGHKKVLEESGHEPFDVRPNINNLILVSYSPFEEFNFTNTKKEVGKSDESGYSYFGFRHKREDGSIGISRDLPKVDAINSLIDAIYEDETFQNESWWVNKFSAVESALINALGIDSLAIKAQDNKVEKIRRLYPKLMNNENLIQLNSEIADNLYDGQFKSLCQLTEGIQFIKDGKVKELSSGQRLFSYIVINVVGAIREHSLVVIDEPELFLHPTLEVEFISLLKTVLKPFKSKAILATHSVSVVREVPTKCVHIFRDEGQGLEVVSPPFETFGGGVQRISSYVFGDKAVSKPFDSWLNDQIKNKSDSERLIRELGEEINEQLIMKIQRLGRLSDGS